MNDKHFHIIFAVILTILLLPVIPEICHFNCWELNGFTKPIQPVELTYANYRNFKFQDYCKKKAEEKLGFKSLLVRSYNQVLFSLFGEISNDDIVIGKDGHLFHKQYTDEYTGVTLKKKYGTIEKAKIAAMENVQETLRLIDTLKQRNIPVLIVLAPSKTAIYPEYLPDHIRDNASPFSLINYYASLYKQNGIPHIDFTPIFKEMKKNTSYPLYTRYGTHWDASTIPFVADTLLRKISEISGFDLHAIQYLDSNYSRRYVLGSDKELDLLSNLLFPMSREKIPNPIFKLKPSQGTRKPKLLIVGDSYYTQLKGTCFKDAFEVVDYWKYNEDAYSTEPKNTGKVDIINRYQILSEVDVVVVMYTSVFAYEYLFGFANTVQQTLAHGDQYDLETAIQKIIKTIKSDPVWFKSVKKQAKERHVSIEQSLRDNAKYVLEQEHKNQKSINS